MRRDFHPILLDYMRKNERIHVILGDLGFRMFDAIKSEFPNRCHNVGARECLMMGAAAGLVRSGKIAVTFSISPFALWRPAEWWRNYADHEKIPIKAIGGGACENGQSDYGEDGYTHNCCDQRAFLSLFPNVKSFFPQNLDELKRDTEEWLFNDAPSYLNLRR